MGSVVGAVVGAAILVALPQALTVFQECEFRRARSHEGFSGLRRHLQ